MVSRKSRVTLNDVRGVLTVNTRGETHHSFLSLSLRRRVVGIIIDKWQFFRILQERGVACPRAGTPTTSPSSFFLFLSVVTVWAVITNLKPKWLTYFAFFFVTPLLFPSFAFATCWWKNCHYVQFQVGHCHYFFLLLLEYWESLLHRSRFCWLLFSMWAEESVADNLRCSRSMRVRA